MIERKVWGKLKEQLKKNEATVIVGPRQVGKTTTVKWLLEQVGENQIYIDLTHARMQELFDTVDYDSIVNYLQNSGLNLSQKAYVAIDEIQFVKEMPRIVKYLYDAYGIKFILTGSSSYYLKNYFSESMAGRKRIFEILPLSFGEFLAFRGVKYRTPELDLAKIADTKFDDLSFGTIGAYYAEYIEFGGFPEVALAESIEDKQQALDEIYSSYINLDVQTLADFRSMADFRRLVSLLGARVGSKINVDELGKIIGLSRPTVMSYLAFLEQTYLIKLVPAYSGSVDVRERVGKKVYFVDNGIANTNADLSGGAKFENMICHQLGFYGRLNFHDRGGEIDFILTDGEGKRCAFEVKETPTDAYLATLGDRARALGIERYALIGKDRSEKFEEYVWGGVL